MANLRTLDPWLAGCIFLGLLFVISASFITVLFYSISCNQPSFWALGRFIWVINCLWERAVCYGDDELRVYFNFYIFWVQTRLQGLQCKFCQVLRFNYFEGQK